MQQTFSNIVLPVVPSTCAGAAWGGVGHPRWLVLLLFWRAAGAQHGPANQEQGGRSPADVEGRPQLSPLCADQEGAVEIPDDDAGRPGHGDEHQKASEEEEDSSDDHHFGLGWLVFDAVGALGADDGDHDPQHAEYDGDDHHGSGGLKLPRQRQQRVVDFALHLARALGHTVHPQTLPDGLSRDDVGPDEGRHPPHRQGTCHNGNDKSNDSKGDAHDLHAHRHDGRTNLEGPTKKKPFQMAEESLLLCCSKREHLQEGVM